MGFWDTLTALFVHDTVKSVGDAIKETKKQAAERYDSYSHKCWDEEKKANNLFLDLLDSEEIAYSPVANRILKERFIAKLNAYPYLIAIEKAGGKVSDFQKEFINWVPASGMRYSGNSIIEAANGRDDTLRNEILDAAIVSNDKLGYIWADLMAVKTNNPSHRTSVLEDILEHLMNAMESFMALDNPKTIDFHISTEIRQALIPYIYQ